MRSKNVIRLEEIEAGHPLRQDPFQAPDGYFENLPMQIQARISAQKPASAFTFSWSWQRSMASLVSASLLAVLVWVTLPERQGSLGKETLSGVSDKAIASYLDEQGVDPYELAEQKHINVFSADNSPLVHYLNLKPEDIRQHINEHQQEMTETLNQDS